MSANIDVCVVEKTTREIEPITLGDFTITARQTPRGLLWIAEAHEGSATGPVVRAAEGVSALYAVGAVVQALYALERKIAASIARAAGKAVA